MRIEIPDMEQWTQIGGDMNPGTYGAIIARSDGNTLELKEIQPVREYVGDDEAADVGFPFWTREASFDLDDLDPDREEVQRALDSIGMSLDDLAANPADRTAAGETGYTPQQRALVIAEALLGYGHADEGPAGWSSDIIHEPVKWWTGTVAGAEYIADEDDEFRREVLGEEDEEEDEEDEDETSEMREDGGGDDECPVIRISFTRITPSEEEDEYPEEEHGWIDEEGVEIEPDEDDLEEGMSESESIVEQAVKFLKKNYAHDASSTHFHKGVWYSTSYETIDFRTGTDEERSFHLDGFSPEEEAEIFKQMTSRRR